MIPVNRPLLPPLEEYVSHLRGVWDRMWLTNDGPLVRDLEARLAEYLGAKHVVFTSNGTIAIQLLIKALDLRGEVVTTPFSYVATTSALVWEGCTAVFADIKPDSLTLDPDHVRRVLTDRTSAILATHVYGTPCDWRGLGDVAAERGIPVIYDAAHAFGAAHQIGRAHV